MTIEPPRRVFIQFKDGKPTTWSDRRVNDDDVPYTKDRVGYRVPESKREEDGS